MNNRELRGIITPKSPDSHSWFEFGNSVIATDKKWDIVFRNADRVWWNVPPRMPYDAQNADFEKAARVANANSKKLKEKLEKCNPKNAKQRSLRLRDLTEPHKDDGQGMQIVRLKIRRPNGKYHNFNGRLAFEGRSYESKWGRHSYTDTYSVTSPNGNRSKKFFSNHDVVGNPEWNEKIKMFTIKVDKN